MKNEVSLTSNASSNMHSTSGAVPQTSSISKLPGQGGPRPLLPMNSTYSTTSEDSISPKHQSRKLVPLPLSPKPGHLLGAGGPPKGPPKPIHSPSNRNGLGAKPPPGMLQALPVPGQILPLSPNSRPNTGKAQILYSNQQQQQQQQSPSGSGGNSQQQFYANLGPPPTHHFSQNIRDNTYSESYPLASREMPAATSTYSEDAKSQNVMERIHTLPAVLHPSIPAGQINAIRTQMSLNSSTHAITETSLSTLSTDSPSHSVEHFTRWESRHNSALDERAGEKTETLSTIRNHRPLTVDCKSPGVISSESIEWHAFTARSPGGGLINTPSSNSISTVSELASQAKEASRNRATLRKISLESPSQRTITVDGVPSSPQRLPTLSPINRNDDTPSSPMGMGGADAMTNRLGDGYGMFCDPWRREKVIGHGQFGIVYKALNVRNGEKLAVKQVRITSASMLDQMIDEVVLMCRASFRNQNVVQCLGWSVTDDMTMEAITEEEQFGMPMQTLDGLDKANAVGKQFNIFMEFVEHGSIAGLLEREGAMSEKVMRNYMRQLLLGLRSLHAAGIAHRDIKCQNLLLSSDYTLKVADFGSAKKVADRTMGPTSSIQGSIPWMSPEVIRQEVGKLAEDEAAKLAGWKLADVWSVGCTMIEMITGKAPWNNYSNPAAMMFAIASAKGPPLLDEGLVHEDGLDFLYQCCQLDPQRRPAVAKLAYHPYIRTENIDEQGEYCRKGKAPRPLA